MEMVKSHSENVIKYEPQGRSDMGIRGQAQQGTTTGCLSVVSNTHQDPPRSTLFYWWIRHLIPFVYSYLFSPNILIATNYWLSLHVWTNSATTNVSIIVACLPLEMIFTMISLDFSAINVNCSYFIVHANLIAYPKLTLPSTLWGSRSVSRHHHH